MSQQAPAGRSQSIAEIAWSCAGLAVWRGSIVLAAAVAGFLIISLAVLLVLRVVDPPASAVMTWHRLSGTEVRHTWVDLERISPALVRAVVASEDARFCRHNGIDFFALEAALRQARQRNSLDIRGASTISMQVVKNMFLWQGKSLLRKGLELSLTPVMEAVWPKRRILEVYLNIAEWGPGIFGAEAAARHHFRRSAASLNAQQAALLAAALPNPAVRRAGRPGPLTRRNARRVRARASGIRPALRCLGSLQRRRG